MNLIQIGTIETPFTASEGVPVQPVSSRASGKVHVSATYTEALKDLDGFERIWLIFWCDRARPPQMIVTPYMDDQPHGLFATRAPSRPNPIGISAVRLDRVEGNTLYISEVDILNGSPLLDIKPYVSKFDNYETERNGWFDSIVQERIQKGRADKRFQQE